MRNPVVSTFGLQKLVSCGKFRNTGFIQVWLVCLACGLSGSSLMYAQGPGFGPPGGDGGGRGFGGDRGGRGGFDPAQMISGMDADKNGVITANEVERVPSFIRDRWQQQGMDFNRGVKVDEMVQGAQRQMDEMRRQRDEGGGRDRGGDFQRSDRPEFTPPQDMGRDSGRDQNRDNRGSSGGAPATSSTSGGASKPRSRIAPLLPESYKAIDTDYDSQIALYEWRKARKGTLSQFATADLDNDGFLTAKELAKILATTPPAAPGTPTSPTATASVAPAAPTAPPAPVSVSVDAAAKAARMFELLDEDKSGTIVGNEWDKSRRLRPQFEKAGLDFKQPLDKEQFAQWYVRAGADR